jgi:hypothetical protein
VSTGRLVKPAPTPINDAVLGKPKQRRPRRDLGGLVAVNGQDADPKLDRFAGAGPAAELEQALAPGVVIAPDRDVAELLGGRGQRRQLVGVRPRRNSKS